MAYGVVVRWTPEVADMFIEVLSKCGNVTLAAQLVGANRRHVYNKRDEDPEFAARWDDAREQSFDLIEEALRDRAVFGTKKPVGFFQGKHGGTFVNEYDTTAGIFLLKGGRPDTYRENVSWTGELKGAVSAEPLTEEGWLEEYSVETLPNDE